MKACTTIVALACSLMCSAQCDNLSITTDSYTKERIIRTTPRPLFSNIGESWSLSYQAINGALQLRFGYLVMRAQATVVPDSSMFMIMLANDSVVTLRTNGMAVASYDDRNTLGQSVMTLYMPANAEQLKALSMLSIAGIRFYTTEGFTEAPRIMRRQRDRFQLDSSCIEQELR